MTQGRSVIPFSQFGKFLPVKLQGGTGHGVTGCTAAAGKIPFMYKRACDRLRLEDRPVGCAFVKQKPRSALL